MNKKQLAGWTLLAAVLLMGMTWVVQGNAFFMYKVFAPRTEQVRREVFEQSRAFNAGMVQELENMEREYALADSTGKAALAPIIIHRASGYNMNDPIVPASLRSFVAQLQVAR